MVRRNRGGYDVLMRSGKRCNQMTDRAFKNVAGCSWTNSGVDRKNSLVDIAIGQWTEVDRARLVSINLVFDYLCLGHYAEGNVSSYR